MEVYFLFLYGGWIFERLYVAWTKLFNPCYFCYSTTKKLQSYIICIESLFVLNGQKVDTDKKESTIKTYWKEQDILWSHCTSCLTTVLEGFLMSLK